MRAHDAMLGQMATRRVDQLRALTHQRITGAKQYGPRPLLLCLNLDEAHGRPARRFADRLRVGSVVLLALDEGLDVGGRNQANFMAKLADDAPQ